MSGEAERTASVPPDRGQASFAMLPGRHGAILARRIVLMTTIVGAAMLAAWTMFRMTRQPDRPSEINATSRNSDSERKGRIFETRTTYFERQPEHLPDPLPSFLAALPGVQDTNSTPPLPPLPTDGLVPLPQNVQALPLARSPNGELSHSRSRWDAPLRIDSEGGAAAPATSPAGPFERGSELADAIRFGAPPAPGQENSIAHQAQRLLHRDLLIPKGTMIDCVLETRLDSTLPGMTRCMTTTDVYAETGRTVLIERGSVITGEYHGDLRPGQERIDVIWDRVRTPRGVIIDVSSPGTDALGTSGLDGHVDEHWFSRIGSAFLLSIVEDVVASAAQREATSGALGNGTLVLTNTSQTGERLAEKVLDNSINRSPTLTKNQGERIGIFVARDLYFDAIGRRQQR